MHRRLVSVKCVLTVGAFGFPSRMIDVQSGAGAAVATRSRRRRPLLPSSVQVPSWLISSVVFVPEGRLMTPSDLSDEPATARVRFWRNGVRWRPSVAVLDLILAIQRLHAWSTMPETWRPYSWRSLALAMVPGLEGVAEAPLLPGGFHAKYSEALLEATELTISIRPAADWTSPVKFFDARTVSWGGGGVAGRRIWAVEFARCFETAISNRPAALNVTSYFSNHTAHLRLAFVLATAAAAHANVSESAPAIRTAEFFLPACGYSEGSWEYQAWGYRLAARICDRIGGLTMPNGCRLQAGVSCTADGRQVGALRFQFWASSAHSAKQIRRVSPTEARFRALLGDALVNQRLRGPALDVDEQAALEKLYFRAGRSAQHFARDRGHWNLLVRLFGEQRQELVHQLRLIEEECDQARTSDHRPDLVAKDLVRVAVFRVRRRLFETAVLAASRS